MPDDNKATEAVAAETKTDTNIVVANVDTSKVEAESVKVERERLESERKAFLAERDAFETERKSAKPKLDNFDIDEALDDPFTYFTERGITPEKAFQLAQSVFFEKHPDKKPSDYELKKTQRKHERMLKKLSEQTESVEKRAAEQAEKKQLEEYNKKLFTEYDTAAAGIKWDERDKEEFDTDFPHSAGFFDDKDDYRQALFGFGTQTAEKLKRVPTIQEVQAELESWLESRFKRVKPKKSKIEQELDKKLEKSVTLSTKDNVIPRNKPLTAEERFERAMAAAETKDIVVKDKK